MKIFESLTRFVQGSALVIALTFLVVGHLPALNVGGVNILPIDAVFAEEITPHSSGSPIQINNHWIEMGECVVDYTERMWDWLESLIDSFVSYSNSANDMKNDHPDVYLKEFVNSAEETQIGSTVYRGFYAKGNTKPEWYAKLAAYFLCFGKIRYLKGEMIDKNTRENCTVFHRDYQFNDNRSTAAGKAKVRWFVGWTKYHLFEHNCQHWADWVLTGSHTGRGSE